MGDFSLKDLAASLYLGGYESGVNYIKKNPMNPEQAAKMDERVANMVSDRIVARDKSISGGMLLNLLKGQRGMYHGQNIGQIESEYAKMSGWSSGRSKDEWENRIYPKYGIKPAPNLIDIFIGKKTPEEEGMRSLDNYGSYYYRFGDGNNKVWDISPYVARVKSSPMVTKEFEGPYDDPAKNLTEALKSLEIGEVISHKQLGETFNPNMIHSLDLGNFNQSFGRDEGGVYYAIADVWDFGSGKGNTRGDLIESLTDGKPINMYGKVYLDDLNVKYDYDDSSDYQKALKYHAKRLKP